MTDRIVCLTPNLEKPRTTRIPTRKFDACRSALLAVLAEGHKPGSQIAEAAGEVLSDETRSELGSIGWNMTPVRLALDVRGEIERLPGARPVILRTLW